MKNLARFFKHDSYMLKGSWRHNGFDSWWYVFSGVNVETGEEKRFFVEYFLVNPAQSPDEIILGQKHDNILYNLHPSYVMIKAGVCGEDSREINNFYPAGEAEINSKILCLQVGPCKMTELAIAGSVHADLRDPDFRPELMTDSGSMRWDLKVFKLMSYLPNAARPARTRFFRSSDSVCFVSGAKCEFEGSVFFEGERYDVSRSQSFGYADKTWGRFFPKYKAKFYSSDISSTISGGRIDDASLVVLGSTQKIAGSQRKRKAVMRLALRSKTYEFNFLTDRNSSDVRIDFPENDESDSFHWILTGENKKYAVDVHFYCKKSQVFALHRESPANSLVYKQLLCGLNCWGTAHVYQKDRRQLELVEDLVIRHGGVEYGDGDVSFIDLDSAKKPE